MKPTIAIVFACATLIAFTAPGRASDQKTGAQSSHMMKGHMMNGQTMNNHEMNGHMAETSAEVKKELSEATRTLQEVTGPGQTVIPRALLSEAAAIAVVPQVIASSAGRHGGGVVAVRQKNGAWSVPVFVDVASAKTAAKPAADPEARPTGTQLVLVFKDPKAAQTLLANGLTLGQGVTASAGPVGRDAKVAGAAEVYTYSRMDGTLKGASLAGCKLSVDHKANTECYGKEYTSAVALASASDVKMAPEQARAFSEMIKHQTSGSNG